MTGVIGTGAAVACVIAGIVLMRTRSTSLANRAALVLFVLAGFGFIVTAFGRVVHGASVAVTRTVADWLSTQCVATSASTQDIVGWVGTGLVVLAGLVVARGVIDGRASVVLAVLAVAFPTLLFYEGGPVAGFATEAFGGLSAMLGEFVSSAREGVDGFLTVMASGRG